ncbi:hypothetical protein LCGC14_0220800 [marine sediment metagenome]|uniref:Uncharacterized protein n=1 Tax=marine sediment metagenome TaxID=412755 RepID=A0A0F9UUN0_9ZZZZ
MSSDQKIIFKQEGIGFCGILFIVLLLLKVGVVETVVMGWSWWWITAPLWGPLSLAVSFIVICLLLVCFLTLVGFLIDLICKR